MIYLLKCGQLIRDNNSRVIEIWHLMNPPWEFFSAEPTLLDFEELLLDHMDSVCITPGLLESTRTSVKTKKKMRCLKLNKHDLK